jgi:hypothetical protein
MHTMIFLSFLLRKFPVYAVSLLMLGLMTVQPLAASELVEEAGEEANLSEKSGDLEFAIGSAEDLSGVHSAVQEEDFQGLDERESSLVVDAQSPDFLAQETEDAELSFPEGGLLRITVTGTRTPRSIEDLPATVTVFDLEDLEFNGVVNLRDLLRYEPGVSVRNDLRYGLQDVNIRGIEGNRILFQLDGIRLPERFEFGPFNIGRGDYVDFATLSTIEVLRGPASTLYGSDALLTLIEQGTETAYIYRLLGDLYVKSGLQLSAEESYQTAIELAAAEPNLEEQTLTYLGLGTLYQTVNKSEKAKDAPEQAQIGATELGDSDLVSSIEDQLSRP